MNKVAHPLLNVFKKTSFESKNIHHDTTSNAISSKSLSMFMKRKIQALKWRQLHQNKDTCEFEINERNLCIQQIINPEENGIGTGGQVWPAAIVLCKYLEKKYSDCCSLENDILRKESKETLEYKKVIELGSGSGVVGIVASLLNAYSVMITDVESVFPLMHKNCERILHESSNYAIRTIEIESESEVISELSRYYCRSVVISPTDNDSNQSTTESERISYNKYVTISNYGWGDSILPLHRFNTRVHMTETTKASSGQNDQISSNLSECLSDHAFDLILISDCILPKLYPIEPLVKVMYL